MLLIFSYYDTFFFFYIFISKEIEKIQEENYSDIILQ